MQFELRDHLWLLSFWSLNTQQMLSNISKSQAYVVPKADILLHNGELLKLYKLMIKRRLKKH